MLFDNVVRILSQLNIQRHYVQLTGLIFMNQKTGEESGAQRLEGYLSNHHNLVHKINAPNVLQALAYLLAGINELMVSSVLSPTL